jgi:hypothetical protein
MPTDTPARGATAQEWREAFIIRQLEARAGRFHRLTGDGVRYVIEAFVPGWTRAEWDWAEDYFREHKAELLALPDLSDQDVRDVEYAGACNAAEAALAALNAGDYDLALYLIDLGQWWHPTCKPWDRYRQVVAVASRG